MIKQPSLKDHTESFENRLIEHIFGFAGAVGIDEFNQNILTLMSYGNYFSKNTTL